jgi:hypothetical protein
MRIMVNELIRLWLHGFWVKTAKYPLGRLIRLILVCVCCDKPAAHKVGGFGSHSHTFFCTRCWIRQSDKATERAFQRDGEINLSFSMSQSADVRGLGFPARTHDEQLKHAQEYARCATQGARDEFVKQFASRWFELARLPYFDVCRMIIIDPMHNLLLGMPSIWPRLTKTDVRQLGLVKTHFYHIWIQLKVLRKTKELRRFHDILSKVSILTCNIVIDSPLPCTTAGHSDISWSSAHTYGSPRWRLFDCRPVADCCDSCSSHSGTGCS